MLIGNLPPPVQETQGPVYSTKPVIRGDITVGVEVSGPLNPSRSGAIQAPGGRNYYEMPSSNIQYTLVEILAEEGSAVKMGSYCKTCSPELQNQIKMRKMNWKMKKDFYLI